MVASDNPNMPAIRETLRRVEPGWLRALRRSWHNYLLLNAEMGQFRTMRKEACTDAAGQPIPWMTYSAIQFLQQLKFSNWSVFEYGSGASTLFWAQRAKTVVSVEDDAEWYDKLKGQLPPHVQYHFARDQQTYVGAIETVPTQFEVIVVDGSYRYDCAVAARRKLHPHGFIIVDNSDWMPKTCQYLRDADLIEVDMSGFGPINRYNWTTSFFFSRQVRLTPCHDRQPVAPPGSEPNNFDGCAQPTEISK